MKKNEFYSTLFARTINKKEKDFHLFVLAELLFRIDGMQGSNDIYSKSEIDRLEKELVKWKKIRNSKL
ncbi:hypothetical protein C4588_07570 [Candidatus Parcubacteria bacterium]|jgi:hypothetical protein|nr:MAG: hypothetical protein C4588_07570 [Candidatus Parcubacteria bacterium]